MVCIYCSSETRVTNSRHQKRSNNVWRRRACRGCGAVFTTEEAADLAKSLVVMYPDGSFTAFQRDKLMLDVYDSLKHRKTAQTDASALTDTILAKILSQSNAGSISADNITRVTHDTLAHFDNAAAVHYAAFHSMS